MTRVIKSDFFDDTLIVPLNELLGYEGGKPVLLGLCLIEPQFIVPDYSTLSFPLDLTNVIWTPTGTAVATGIPDPDAGTDAASFTEDGSAGVHGITQGAGGMSVSTGPCGARVRVKKDGRNFMCLDLKDATNEAYATINLTNGAVATSSNAGSPTVSNLGGGWLGLEFQSSVAFDAATITCNVWPSTDGTLAGCTYAGTPALVSGYGYEPELVQTSALSVLNFFGDRALQLCGTRLDLYNLVKSQQGVYSADAWGGHPGLLFSQGNVMYVPIAFLGPLMGDALGPTSCVGEASQSTHLFAYYKCHWSFDDYFSVTPSTPFRGVIKVPPVNGVQYYAKDDAGVSAASAEEPIEDYQRTVLICTDDSSTATMVRGNTTVFEDIPFALGATTFNQLAFGCQLSSGYVFSFWDGILRLFLVTRTKPSADVLKKVSRVIQQHCPLV
jgi:hypothetical protein